MPEIFDPWKEESQATLPAALLHGEMTDVLAALEEVNDHARRLSVEQADAIYRRYVAERSEPFRLGELDQVLYAMAMARHPKAPGFIEYVFGMDNSDFVALACRALLAWHGLPDLFLIWASECNSDEFEQMPVAAQDYIRGVDLWGTWSGCGTDFYLEDATPEKLQAMAEAFVRMDMPGAAAGLQKAGEWWEKMEELHSQGLSDEEFEAQREVLHEKCEPAQAGMNGGRSVLEGITRFAARHSEEFRRVLGWTAPVPPTAA